MTHNGGRSQLQAWYLGLGGDYPWIDHFKGSDIWKLVSGGTAPAPDTLGTTGLPISLPGSISRLFSIPSSTNRPGHWVADWVGEFTWDISGTHTTVSGSKSGVNGRTVLSMGTTSVNFSATAINASNPPTRLRFFHEDDEALINAGEIFTPRFLSKVEESGVGVWRSGVWGPMNETNVSVWAHRKPLDYISYAGSEFRSSLYAGLTSNVGDDYTAVYAPLSSPTDKLTFHVMFNATSSGTSPTLNGIAIKAPNGATLADTERPRINKVATLVYDADLGFLLKFGGDVALFDQGLVNGVPPEVLVHLANRIGMHLHTHIPPLSVDPLQDYAVSQHNYLKANLESGLRRIYEVANEQWNSIFFVNGYATRKGVVAGWGSENPPHNWYGRALSRVGEALDAAGGDYELTCGVQSSTYLATSSSDARLTSAKYLLDSPSKRPASDYVSHVAVTTYVNSRKTVQEEIALALTYYTASAEDKFDILTEYFQLSAEAAPGGGLAQSYINWKAWAAGRSVYRMISYEGNWSQDYPVIADPIDGANDTTITAISKAVQAVVTLSSGSTKPPVGIKALVENVGGMTELNNHYYTVVAVNGNLVTLDVDSTGFTTFTSAGRMRYFYSHPVTNITKATQALVTLDPAYGPPPTAGFSITFFDVSGMTEINALGATIASVNGQVCTMNLNTSGFSTYTSGGRGQYRTNCLRRLLRKDSKMHPEVYNTTVRNYDNFLDAGGEFPSCFMLSGADVAWSIFDPTIYADPSPQWDAIALFNTRRRRARLTVTA